MVHTVKIDALPLTYQNLTLTFALAEDKDQSTGYIGVPPPCGCMSPIFYFRTCQMKLTACKLHYIIHTWIAGQQHLFLKKIKIGIRIWVARTPYGLPHANGASPYAYGANTTHTELPGVKQLATTNVLL